MFSANSSQVSDDKLFVEDVFSTYLYTGNGSTQTITNGIDLAGKGGLVWVKSRSAATGHVLVDTVRGAGNFLSSNTTTENLLRSGIIGGFSSTGFSVDAVANTATNNNADTYASWTFREAPNFFDVVTWTGNDVAGRNINHNLGSAPGVIFLKATSTSGNWHVYHRSLGANQNLRLNATSAATFNEGIFPRVTSTSFGVDYGDQNASGVTYVAYLYAHDTASTGIIQCGSYVADNSTYVNLGWEPQFIMFKRADSTSDWFMVDNMRGFSGTPGSISRYVAANLADAEQNIFTDMNATGFFKGGATGGTYIYVAIRRGPMRTPTLGTSVFVPWTRTGTGTTTVVSSTTFPPDLLITRPYASNEASTWFDRLRGRALSLLSNSTGADTTTTTTTNDLVSFNMNGITVGANQQQAVNTNGASIIDYNFRRAPGFFDEVCYTGTGANLTLNHNLGVAPELIIIKRRNSTGNWVTGTQFTPTTGSFGWLNVSDGFFRNFTYAAIGWFASQPTSSTFSVLTDPAVNGSGGTYVTYLFASAPGVSKVGSYTGNGSSQTINCAFTTGARFVLIKRTDSTGGWLVWDTARGIVAGNDPHLSLNTTAAEVTTDDTIDTDSSGFVVNQVAATNVNVSSATYIYLAIA